MLMNLFNKGGDNDVYVATIINDYGSWDGVELVHLSTRVSVRSTTERSAFLNHQKARQALGEVLTEKGVLIDV